VIDVGIAKAEEPTPTPSPDWQPLFPTNTPAPTENYQCPEGNPYGWGTVTPDPYWWINCANCITPGSQTQGAESTPDLTSTPTPDTGEIHVKAFGYQPMMPLNCGLYGDPPAQHCLAEWYLTIPEADNGQEIVGWLWGGVDPNWNNASYHYSWAVSGLYKQGGSDIDYETSYWGHTTYDPFQITVGDIRNLIPWLGHIREEIGAYWEPPVNGMDGGTYLMHYWFPGYAVGGEDWYLFMFYTGTELGAVPTPTPIAGYCGSVQGGGGQGELESWLPQILVAEGSCTQILGWTIDLSVLNWLPGLEGITEVSLPGFHLCVNPIQFGEVQLFGVGIDLDLIAFLGAGLVILRILLRS